jgi:hypothetical protein
VHEEDWVDVGEEEVALAAGDAPVAPAAEVSPVFATVKEAKAWGIEHLVKTPVAMYPCAADREKTAETHYILGHDCVPILTVQDLLRTSRLTAGQGKSREAATGSPRCHPVLVDGAVRFVVVFKSFWRKP